MIGPAVLSRSQQNACLLDSGACKFLEVVSSQRYHPLLVLTDRLYQRTTISRAPQEANA